MVARMTMKKSKKKPIPAYMLEMIECDHDRRIYIERTWATEMVVAFSEWFKKQSGKRHMKRWAHECSAGMIALWLKRSKSRQLSNKATYGHEWGTEVEKDNVFKHTIRMQAAMIRSQSRRLKTGEIATSF